MSSLTSLNHLGKEGVEGFCNPSCSWKVNKKFIPLKIIYFCYMAGQGGSVVFRSLFIKHVGMTTTQNGIIWAVDRVFGIFVPPLLGGISDKSGRPRATILWLLFSGGLACASLCFVPSHKNRGERYKCGIYERLCYLEQDPQKCFPSCFLQNTSLGIGCSMTSLRQSCITYDEFENNSQRCLQRNFTSLYFTELGNHYMATGGVKEFWHHSLQVACQTLFPSPLRAQNLSLNVPQTWLEFQNFDFDVCNCSWNKSFESNEIGEDYGITFWLLLILLMLGSVSVFGVGTLVDSFVMGSLPEKEKHRFSQQRLWGGVGFGAATLLVGYIKDVIANHVTDQTSNVMFYPFFFSPGIFWIVLCVTMGCFTSNVIRKEDEEKIRFKAFKILLTNPRIFAFLIYTITLGIDMSLCEIYMFWLAEQRLQASSTILAAAIACSTCFEIVAYLVSGCFVRRFGAILVMTVGLLMLGTRLILYTLVTQPWHLLLAEMLRGLGWPTAWIAVCHHTTLVSPPGLAATTMGMVQATTFGVGYGIGALFGGYLFEKYGGDVMFQIMFVLVMVNSLLYFIFYQIVDWWSKKRKTKESKQDVEAEAEKLKKVNLQEDLNHNVGEFGDYGSKRTEKKKIMLQSETVM